MTGARPWATSSPTATCRRCSRADDYSAVGIAGTAGLAIELVKLFQVELEHYEKIEGTLLSLEGKANRLATMIRGNLGMAMQGLAVVPLFAGFDLEGDVGRIFSYDVTGGCYEEHDHHSVGSGSLFARGVDEEAVAPGHRRRRGGAGRDRGAVRRRRRRLRHGRAGPRPADLADAGGSSTPRGCGSCPTTQLADVVEQIVADRRDNPGGAR